MTTSGDKKVKPPTTLGRTMIVAAEVNRKDSSDQIVKAAELVTIRPAKGRSLGLAARRALNLMIKVAGGDAWKSQTFSIHKSQIRLGHEGGGYVEEVMNEIATTQVHIDTISVRGKPAVLKIPILTRRIDERDSDGLLYFEFHEDVRALLMRSETYALLSGQALMGFESKYALVLYEIGCQVSGRRNPTELLTVAKLRELIGVPDGKMLVWSDLRRFALEKAQVEIDQLAHFTFTWDEIKQGRKVVQVRLIFRLKTGDAALEAAEEAERHSVGRRARRVGSVEKVVAPSPALPSPLIREEFPVGTINYSEPWRTIARGSGGGWDINEIATEFRKSPAATKLKGKRLEAAFTSFCEKWAENRKPKNR